MVAGVERAWLDSGRTPSLCPPTPRNYRRWHAFIANGYAADRDGVNDQTPTSAYAPDRAQISPNLIASVNRL